MIKNFKNQLKKNILIFGLVFLILITALSTSFFNYKKNAYRETYNNFIDNIYFKKTLIHIIENLEPKYKKVKHKIKSGETFDKILEKYIIDKNEIIKVKNFLKKKLILTN